MLALTAESLVFEISDMDYDRTKIEEAVLALLAAFSFDGSRAWKGFSFEVMDRLHEPRIYR